MGDRTSEVLVHIPGSCSRRDFIGRSASCAAHLGLMAAAAPFWRRASWSAQERFPVVASEPWGRLERLAEGVWALVSTPLEDRTTLCNGGIVSGRTGVALIESFGSDAGARWMMEQAIRLAGRPPTHVVLTHYHGDHTGGLRGVGAGDDVDVLATSVTRDLTRARNQGAPADVLDRVRVLDGRRPTEIDLGGRSLLVVPRRGHTDSDVTVELADPSVTFCGDLVWNAMFPNYVDATPSRISQAVRLMRTLGADTYVPGHGPFADGVALDAYIGLLDDVEGAARSALERGMSAEEAGASYRVPAGLEDWTLFNPSYFARALDAWMREITPR
jgi:glyoxylase-like metal-dependent hydrolase (beta-lactamase superfamily II)